jgi:hypothetical protein
MALGFGVNASGNETYRTTRSPMEVNGALIQTVTMPPAAQRQVLSHFHQIIAAPPSRRDGDGDAAKGT